MSDYNEKKLIYTLERIARALERIEKSMTDEVDDDNEPDDYGD